ncbi:MAG: PilZ domain-containing protein [Lachnospiraceae bacterium]|nr:PilZ domain-containing protein [Lachnospiraceae bacterium]
MKLSEIKPGENIILVISKDTKRLQMEAHIAENHSEVSSSIVLHNQAENKRLVFDNVDISVQYQNGDTLPIQWNSATITSVPGKYELRAKGEGKPVNRRNCFRVGVSAEGTMIGKDHQPKNVTIRDVSLSGFSITDKFGTLDIKPNDLIKIEFEDEETKIKLEGRAVRVAEQDNKTIYGFVITSICSNLSPYIMVKQRKMSKTRNS